MENVDLRHLRYFVAVAEELHFSRAARRLNVSQPPLSQQIRQLERAIGAPLFVRTSRRVELTPAGSALLDGARRTLAEASRSLDAAERAGRGEVDRLRVGYTGSGALGGLVEIVRAFRAAYPLIHLEMIEGTTETQIEAIDRDLVDVALVRGPIIPGRAKAEVVRREPFLAVLPADHRLTARHVVPMAVLRDEPFILFPRHIAPPHYDVLMGICEEAGFEPRVSHESAEYDTILSLVAAGLGVTLVPSSVRRLRFEGVEFRRLSGVRATAELAVIYQPHRMSRALSAFLAIAAKR
jgi:LysR family transcriptional regulator, benzoate and cis,cis-muconate-responsive activator of ben and cat genes